MKYSLCAVLATVAFSGSAAAEGLKIVLSNDDGLTANVVALHTALEVAGHDVIVSVPCQNQSGMSGAIKFSGEFGPLTENCLHDAALVGAPAAGPATLEGLAQGDFFYVEGTPVMAVMYGLDAVAVERWGGAPDLVMSGPNGGQNVGAVTLNSGTIGAAQHAASRGIPSIALSAGSNSEGEPLSPGETSIAVAELSADLVNALADVAGEGALLPEGLALNVNFPDDLGEAEWQATEIGTYAAYSFQFVDNVAENPSPIMVAMAEREGRELPAAPGMVFDFNRAAPTDDQLDDEGFVYRTHIAVSPMDAGYSIEADGGFDVSALVALLQGNGGEDETSE